MKRTVAIVIIALIAVSGVVWAVASNSDKTNTETNKPALSPTSSTTNNSNSNTTSNSTESENTSTDTANATITYTDDGFGPSTLTVKVGTKVTIKNDSSSDLEFSSDDHPTHTKDPEINTEAIGPGETTTITPTTKGTHGYHNHLNPSDTGTLVVQ